MKLKNAKSHLELNILVTKDLVKDYIKYETLPKDHIIDNVNFKEEYKKAIDQIKGYYL